MPSRPSSPARAALALPPSALSLEVCPPPPPARPSLGFPQSRDARRSPRDPAARPPPYTSYCAGLSRLQDLHVYDPATMAWTNLSAAASGTPPSGRDGHGFTSAGGKLYVHGGRDAYSGE